VCGAHTIYSQEADFTPHFYSMTTERNAILANHSLYPTKDSICILSHPLQIMNPSESQWNIFTCFSAQIWSLIALFYMLYGVVNFADHRAKSGKSFVENYIEMFAMLIGQGLTHPNAN
jgi:hypothetical protein